MSVLSTMSVRPLLSALLLLLVLVTVPGVRAEAFTSTAHLRQLVAAERDLARALRTWMEEERAQVKLIQRALDGPFVVLREQRLATVKSIIESMETTQEPLSKNTDGLTFIDHPINAYNLVKRWHTLSVTIDNLQQFSVVAAHGVTVPSADDVAGAGAALLRLQRTYGLHTARLVAGNVLGRRSVEPLAPQDVYSIGLTALADEDYGLAAQWLGEAAHLGAGDPNFPVADAYVLQARAHKAIGDLESAVVAAEKAAETQPDNSTIEAEKLLLLNRLEFLRMRDEYEPVANMTTWERPQKAVDARYEALCRGDTWAGGRRPGSQLLTCRYKRGTLPYVVYKEEILSWDPRISSFYEVISDGEAEKIKEMATPHLLRAVVGIDLAAVKTRVSKVAWLWDSDSLFISKLGLRVKDITGLETKQQKELTTSEPFQVVNYGLGGQYEPHVDYFEDRNELKRLPLFLQSTGDRLTTFLFYLSRIEHGGATVYPNIGVRVPPVKNGAAFWYNAKPSGEFDVQTTHAGCPVLLGEKWIANKWIREYGQEFRRPCALKPDAVWNV